MPSTARPQGNPCARRPGRPSSLGDQDRGKIRDGTRRRPGDGGPHAPPSCRREGCDQLDEDDVGGDVGERGGHRLPVDVAEPDSRRGGREDLGSSSDPRRTGWSSGIGYPSIMIRSAMASDSASFDLDHLDRLAVGTPSRTGRTQHQGRVADESEPERPQVRSRPGRDEEERRRRRHQGTDLVEDRRRVGERLEQHHEVVERALIGGEAAGPPVRRPVRAAQGRGHGDRPGRVRQDRLPGEGVRVRRLRIPPRLQVLTVRSHHALTHSLMLAPTAAARNTRGSSPQPAPGRAERKVAASAPCSPEDPTELESPAIPSRWFLGGP